MLNLLEQQLVGPNGGEPISLKKDIFGPLGDRLTLVSDFKKPVKDDSQRLLLGVALDDSKAFTNTLTKILGMTGAPPRSGTSRAPPSTTSSSPRCPAGQRRQQPLQERDREPGHRQGHPVRGHRAGPARIDPPGRGSSLADSPEFQAVAKQIPAKTSSLTYARPTSRPGSPTT